MHTHAHIQAGIIRGSFRWTPDPHQPPPSSRQLASVRSLQHRLSEAQRQQKTPQTQVLAGAETQPHGFAAGDGGISTSKSNGVGGLGVVLGHSFGLIGSGSFRGSALWPFFRGSNAINSISSIGSSAAGSDECSHDCGEHSDALFGTTYIFLDLPTISVQTLPPLTLFDELVVELESELWLPYRQF